MEDINEIIVKLQFSNEENQKLKNELKETQNTIIKLERRIKDLVCQSYYDRLTDIYHYFDKNGIRKTATRFKMHIKDVIEFIIDCDNNECGVSCAHDYRECYAEVYGDNNSDDSA